MFIIDQTGTKCIEAHDIRKIEFFNPSEKHLPILERSINYILKVNNEIFLELEEESIVDLVFFYITRGLCIGLNVFSIYDFITNEEYVNGIKDMLLGDDGGCKENESDIS